MNCVCKSLTLALNSSTSFLQSNDLSAFFLKQAITALSFRSTSLLFMPSTVICLLTFFLSSCTSASRMIEFRSVSFSDSVFCFERSYVICARDSASASRNFFNSAATRDCTRASNDCCLSALLSAVSSRLLMKDSEN